MRKSRCLSRISSQGFILMDFSSWERDARGGISWEYPADILGQGKESAAPGHLLPFPSAPQEFFIFPSTPVLIIPCAQPLPTGKEKEKEKQCVPTPLRFLLLLYNLSHLKTRFVPSRDAVDWN